jgi:hypothetical protein
MNKKIISLMCLLMALVWLAGCECMRARPAPAVAAPVPVVEPAPDVAPAPPPPVVRPAPVEEPAPSKKMKQRVIKDTD